MDDTFGLAGRAGGVDDEEGGGEIGLLEVEVGGCEALEEGGETAAFG